MDQGLFAASNFVLNVLLARWLSESGYGEFSVAFTVFLFLGVIFNSVVTEPMFVMGPSRYDQRFPTYLKAMRRLHWRWVGWVVAAFGLLASLFYLHNGVFVSLVALSLCSPVVFDQWLLRRACYIRTGPWVAAVGGVLYCGVMIGGISILNQSGHLSPVSGIITIGVASAAASFWIKRRLAPRAGEVEEPVTLDEVRDAHWGYGKWSLASNIVAWVPANIYMLLLPWWHGSEAAGAFRAGSNFSLPMLQVQATAAMVIFPALVRIRAQAGYQRRVLAICGLLAGASAGYLGAIWLGGEVLFRWLYDGKFPEHAGQVWMFVLPAVPGAAMAVLSCGVRAMEAPDKVFRAYVVSLAVCIMAGLPLTYVFGVVGVAWAISLSSTVCAIALFLQLRGLAGGRYTPPAAPGNIAATAPAAKG